MATIVKGTTFTTTVTAGGMHALVESATISAITRTSMRITEASLGTRSTTEPTGASAREVWQPSPGNGLATYDTTVSGWVGGLPQFVRFQVPSSSPTSVLAGDLLSFTSTVSGDFTNYTVLAGKASSANIFGVSLTAVAQGGYGIAVTKGPVRVASSGGVNAGESVRADSSNAGKIQPVAAPGSGYGFDTIGLALEDESGGFVWIALRR